MKSATARNWFPEAFGHSASLPDRAFTLIEIMVVVAIFGVVLTMGVPSFVNVLHKEPLRKEVERIVEECGKARARAILSGETSDLWLNAPVPGSFAARAESVTCEMLDVNFIEYKEAGKARVRFHPNGTCDELTIVLRSDQNEYRKISLECTTGLVTVESIR